MEEQKIYEVKEGGTREPYYTLADVMKPADNVQKDISDIRTRLDNMAKAFKRVMDDVELLKTKKGKDAPQVILDEVLIRKVAANVASDDELKTLLHLSREYNLDPLKKEIWFIKYGGKATIIVSRDGYLKIANADDNFDGIESDVVYVGDKLEKRQDTSFHITYGENHIKHDKAALMGAFCNIFRKDRSTAVSVFVPLKDYNKPGDMWKNYTYAMILKVAESMALKRAFALSGLVSGEEVEEKE